MSLLDEATEVLVVKEKFHTPILKWLIVLLIFPLRDL